MSSEWPPRPSVFTPFLRRFTDERLRDRDETIALWREVRETFRASRWSEEDIIPRLANTVMIEIERGGPVAHEGFREALERCIIELLSLETTFFTFPEIDWDTVVLSAYELVDLRRFLRAQQHFLANEDRVIEQLIECLSLSFFGAVVAAERIATDDALFTVPLIEAVEHPAKVVDTCISATQWPESLEAGLFTSVRRTLLENTCAVSGVLPDAELKKPLQIAANSTLPPRELAETYLRGAPFLELLMTEMPLAVPFSVRFEHTHILAGSGHGKTQTLQHLILSDMQRDPPPSLIIIDGQGEMIDKLSRLALFQDRDDPIIIDPRDTPALNLFDVNLDRLSQYGPMYKEQILNGVI